MIDLDGDLSRRELLSAAALVGGVAVGAQIGQEPRQAMLPPGSLPDDEGVRVVDGDVSLLLAVDFGAVSLEDVSPPAILWTEAGNQYLIGGTEVATTIMSDITIQTGATDYDHAESLVDTYPTLVFTESGNQYLFTQ